MTPSLAECISSTQMSRRSVMLWWLGQAGFALKTSAGKIVLVDPYSPSALTLLVEAQDVRVLFTGDTSLRPDLLKPLLDRRIDLLAPCINGGFGNMGHIDAARLVQAAKPKYAIPCHFWTFAEQGAGDPWGFIQACQFLCPDVSALRLKPGEQFLMEAQ